MASETVHKLCQDCLKREECDYIPTGGNLIRCLDRQAPGGKEVGETQPPFAFTETDTQNSALLG